jgi:hypothetical protein
MLLPCMRYSFSNCNSHCTLVLLLLLLLSLPKMQ